MEPCGVLVVSNWWPASDDQPLGHGARKYHHEGPVSVMIEDQEHVTKKGALVGAWRAFVVFCTCFHFIKHACPRAVY
jgi:hypothetical protein